MQAPTTESAPPAAGSLLVVYCASGDSLIEQLGALRCAVCIARALGAELVIPRWKCGLYWLASEHVIDAAPLAALVPLVSEQDAQARCATRTAVAAPALPFSVLPTRVSTFCPPQGAESPRLTRSDACAWEPAARQQLQRTSRPT